jgi:uncharacterized protein YbjT (DUF2867 family)
MNVIVTGATGMVGEGVLLACLADSRVNKVLAVARRPSGHTHAKLTEIVVADFQNLGAVREQLRGYDACFYCAGISSVGMKEPEYTRVTFDTPLAFAKVLVELNPQMVMCHVSGRSTDSTEQGKVMWARVKGKAENALMKQPFKAVYNFRPALMVPVKGQLHVKTALKVLTPVFAVLMSSATLKLEEVERAMVNAVLRGAPRQVLEVDDIRALAG